jgi:hypothetical protein
MRSSVAGMSPAKIAMAEHATMAPDRRDRVHEEGDRDEERDRHGRGQARDGSDEQAKDRRQEDREQHVRLEDQVEGLPDGAHRLTTTVRG